MRLHVDVQPRRSSRGFSLIELMIAVVIVGVLASLAYPSFMGSIRKSRRAEAFSALAAVQQAQERWRANNANYASDLTSAAPTGLGLSSSTPNSYYTISVVTDVGTIATTYEAVATAVAGSSQASDGNCAKMGVRMSSATLTYGGTTASGTLSYGLTSPCWSR